MRAFSCLRLIILRQDATLGFVAIAFLFAIVWATGHRSLFRRRAIGGPKLWPAVSPKKTWSGAIGGLLAAPCGLLVAMLAGLAIAPMLRDCVALGLSVVSQGGDLLESRSNGASARKDASQLIPPWRAVAGRCGF